MRRSIARASVVAAALVAVASCGKKEPQPKTKDEAFQVFEKHKATYIRCEKLMAQELAAVAPPASSEPVDAGAAAAADAAADAGADAGKRPGADAGRKATPAPAASASAGPPGGASSAMGTSALEPTSAEAGVAPPVGAAQECQTEYWREMKRDMGPYDQATMDLWYAEWRKGVKVE